MTAHPGRAMEKHVAAPIRHDRDAMGELFIWTDIDPAHEEDFNQWYDREHMAERAGIAGFRWARRYRSQHGRRRYLALYRTENLHVFGSAAYRQAFERQTPWSLANFARMRDTNRRVMVVSPLAGVGTGAALGLLRLGSVELAARAAALAASAQEIEGVLALRVLTPDPQLSTPLPSEDPAARVLDPVLIIDATTEPAAAARSLAEQLELPTDGIQTFHLLWDLRADDLHAAP
ncbi:DUF4286 family protein [Bordetella parapertussis]|uniref:Uncharacterized protein n=1 Tax=Bordetella parapertussis (strain Bpp5) TaxID=1208660 RepID=K0M9D1_BORPB|nr:conserved hypothetical protein [Bordetella parapertussis Bpp5]